MISGEAPSGWDAMRELFLPKERSKTEGEEAPSGYNYLPHLNNAFVVIIIEQSLTASTWDLTGASENIKIAHWNTGKASCPARPGWCCGHRDGGAPRARE